MEAEVRVMQGHKPRNAGWPLEPEKKPGNRFLELPEEMQPC